MSNAADPRELYRALVLEHARTPHNFRQLADATHQAKGHNPLCGDTVSVYVRTRDSRVEDIAFEAAGCAISVASASMLTDMVKGATVTAASRIADHVCEWLGGNPGATAPPVQGPVESLAEVRAFPSRVRCATLPWKTFRAALRSESTTVTTEVSGID